MQIPRQLRAGGGIMTLEEPRQGFFLGKIVKKAKRAVKKIVKSPIGKAAMIGALGYGLGGAKFLGGKGIFAGGQGLGRFANLKNLFLPSYTTGYGPHSVTRKGLLSGLAFDDKGKFSLGRAALSGLGATALAAPFLMGGDEEEVEEETPFTQTPDSISSIVNMAKNQDPSLRFLPKPKFVDNFYLADGGLAGERPGYNQGEMVEGVKEGIETVADDENMMMAGMGNVMKLFENYDGSFDRGAFEDMLIQYEDSGAKANGVKLMDFAVDFLGISSMKEGGRVPMQEGGIMDMGGLEKDYREGGFVPIGAEERADDVPARLSKNEFVFTADAVRNAGQGDIDKGAEVMQNMMDNLEAGGTISEESQGMNPAQEMFDQAQMLEGRLA
jgi:hypothetical protein